MSRRRGEAWSKRGSGNSQQDEVGRTIHKRVEKLMANRWKYLTPFDLFTDVKAELYRYAMSNQEWEALQLLEVNREFRKAMSYTDRVFIHHPNAGFNLTIPVTGERFVALGLNWDRLPEEIGERIHNWVIRSESYRWEFIQAKERVGRLVRLCATPGQIERVWPELMGFMPSDVLDTRFNRKAKSPYPEGVWEEYDGGTHPDERVLKEHFRPESLEWFNDALAEALILPLQDWEKMPPYPEVSILK